MNLVSVSDAGWTTPSRQFARGAVVSLVLFPPSAKVVGSVDVAFVCG